MSVKAEWAIDLEAIEARGVTVLEKSNWLVQKNIETKRLALVKAGLESYFAAKTFQIWRVLFSTSGL